MTAVLIAYDLRAPGQKYDALIEKIKSYGNWAHPLESTWIVTGSYLTAEGVYEALRPILDDNDHIFCVEIDGKGRQGWLSKEIWEWIRKHV
ncbi:Smr/MutS family protein (plasmid) [Clavibacter michiganensis subsp. michiganensis]|uniref:SinR family protein n=1 Tax=Clavibacter michiganensis subsp. michiganensis (strain NCPPB 382) TaxID=443906 RepID=A5CLK9_CLAM3|nr:Smr/MutS family protein [Clavibacter michiganensis]MDO4101243.1 Smr/MutS family protein [Clavibacter michiganensis]MDO4129129.1 Smr/MutS family protein [Clavibacter michiganensis]QXP07563.1 Smr/MutS family protein [Clavibacter michiganensis subsp. michiganensis]CAM98479.1 conserved hypothetical protein [Clavibacter michiganensis subsp. michiganensis NCPPB 382]